MNNEPKENKTMKWTEVINETAWVVEDLLTQEECQHFLDKAGGVELMAAPSKTVRYRDCLTCAVDDDELAQRIYERIKAHLPQELSVTKDCTNLGLRDSKDQLLGTWRLVGLNSHWRVVCYPGKGHFAAHRDSCYRVSEHHRSLLTINGYLTNRPVGFGGATRFLKDDIPAVQDEKGKFVTPPEAVLHRVEADQAGKAVVFLHDLMHEGEPLVEGSPPKWLFRTDVMYKRDPDTAPKLTENQRSAQELVVQAEQAEQEGQMHEAMRLYNKAYRLDPRLETPNN